MLPQHYRLKSKRDFSKVYRHGKSSANDLLVIYRLPNRTDTFRIGFSVSKKVGNAVVRNRIKRILREVCRANIHNFSAGYDIIFIARQKIRGINYHVIECKVLNLMKKAGVYQDG